MCFSGNPLQDLEKKISEPDIAGISIRHIDTVLYQFNEFFIYEVKEYVEKCKKMNLKVILGGAGYSIMPAEILSYTGLTMVFAALENWLCPFWMTWKKGNLCVITDGLSFFTGNMILSAKGN